jgi:hypothetical protein
VIGANGLLSVNVQEELDGLVLTPGSGKARGGLRMGAIAEMPSSADVDGDTDSGHIGGGPQVEVLLGVPDVVGEPALDGEGGGVQRPRRRGARGSAQA